MVTSKIVSKSEGRVRTGVDRDDVIDDETVRVVSQWTTPRGRTVIAQTRHGFVMAAAGVDASNVANGSVVLLPEDPDGSARALRAGLRERFGVSVGVVLSDTAGRPWRDGVVDFAVGAAGVVARDDLRGRRDGYGNVLGVTVVALADELAAATELVRSKLAGVPVAVVRGLDHLVTAGDGPGAGVLIRTADEDRFRLGTPEAMRAAVFARRDVRAFTAEPVDPAAVRRAVAAALTAPRPAGADPQRRARGIGTTEPLWRFVLVESAAAREQLCDAVADGEPLQRAPLLIVPCLLHDGEPGWSTGPPPDALLRMGAAIENLLVALAADDLGASWRPVPDDGSGAIGTLLELPDHWQPAGVVAVGHPAAPGSDHPQRDPSDYIVTR